MGRKSSIKKKYRVSNWKEYDQALVNRGSLTIWFEASSIEQWYHSQKTGKPGASKTYSDMAILCGLTLRAVYHLPFRATAGLIRSITQLMGLALEVPDHTTFSRRQKILEVFLPQVHQGAPLHVVIDSTGLKVYGEGEWKVRIHGVSKRRTWRKLHLAVDERSKSILVAVFSTNDFKDSQLFSELIAPIDQEIEQVSADGAYDGWEVWEKLESQGIKGAIPPQKNAKIRQHGNCQKEPLMREEHLREMRKVGRMKWKKNHNYHRRSLAENAMFRFKKLFGSHLNNRNLDHQAIEAFTCCKALNKMTLLGMPMSYIVQ